MNFAESIVVGVCIGVAIISVIWAIAEIIYTLTTGKSDILLKVIFQELKDSFGKRKKYKVKVTSYEVDNAIKDASVKLKCATKDAFKKKYDYNHYSANHNTILVDDDLLNKYLKK